MTMRIAISSLLVLAGLLIAAASVAGDHSETELRPRPDQEAIEAPLEAPPSVEAAPPDTPIAQLTMPEEMVPAEAIDEPHGYYDSTEEPDGHYD
jgi:hypothetical protein